MMWHGVCVMQLCWSHSLLAVLLGPIWVIELEGLTVSHAQTLWLFQICKRALHTEASRPDKTVALILTGNVSTLKSMASLHGTGSLIDVLLIHMSELCISTSRVGGVGVRTCVARRLSWYEDKPSWGCMRLQRSEKMKIGALWWWCWLKTSIICSGVGDWAHWSSHMVVAGKCLDAGIGWYGIILVPTSGLVAEASDTSDLMGCVQRQKYFRKCRH